MAQLPVTYYLKVLMDKVGMNALSSQAEPGPPAPPGCSCAGTARGEQGLLLVILTLATCRVLLEVSAVTYSF